MFRRFSSVVVVSVIALAASACASFTLTIRGPLPSAPLPSTPVPSTPVPPFSLPPPLSSTLPPPPPASALPDPPPPKELLVYVKGEDDEPLNNISGHLVRFDDKDPVDCRPRTFEMLACPLPGDLDFGAMFTGHFLGKEHDERVEVITARADPITVQLAASARFLPPLERRGQFYFLHGQPFTIIGASEFRLYERYLRGEDITPVLAELQAIGFNYVRVWLLNTSVGRIVPSDWGDSFYTRLRPFIGLLGRYGLYAEFTVFTMPGDLMPTRAEQQSHYDRTVSSLGDAFVFIEGANEIDAYPANKPAAGLRWWKPEGATFDLSLGSNGSDSDAPEPVFDSCRYHSNDANEWWRRQAHNGMEQADRFGVPCWADENTRPDRDPSADPRGEHAGHLAQHYFDAAAGAALLSAGSTFHSESGKNAVVFSGRDREAAVAHVAGAKSVDLSQRTGHYQRRDDLNGSDALRSYQRGAATVRVRK